MSSLFQIATGPYWWPVSLPVPADGGRHTFQKIEIQFNRFTRDQNKELGERLDAVRYDDNLDKDTDYIMEIARDWRGKPLNGPDGELIPFTRENLRSLLNIVNGASGAIVDAWLKASIGREAIRGN